MFVSEFTIDQAAWGEENARFGSENLSRWRDRQLVRLRIPPRDDSLTILPDVGARLALNRPKADDERSSDGDSGGSLTADPREKNGNRDWSREKQSA
jgi:hypothetical protein